MADQTIQRVFVGGEISPGLHARSDLQRYLSSLALCENMIVSAQGGVYSRPGTRYIGSLSYPGRKGRLIPFSFNTEQTYILVFEHLKMRVITQGGFVLDDQDEIYELTTPYTEEELPRLTFVQDADVMTIAHRNHDPRFLSRLDHDDWDLSSVNYAATVDTPSGVTAASTGSGHGDENKTYRYVVTAMDADEGESLPSSEVSVTLGSLSVTGGVSVKWGAVTGAQYYRVYKDPSDGSEMYGWIGDTKTTEFKDFNVAPVVSDAPPSDYLPFTGARNRPATVGYYQQRQVFGNTLNEPQKVFMSQSGVYNSMRFSSPSRDDDAIFFTIKARQVNEIRHIVSLDSLIFLTSGGEWRVTEGQDQVLTPFTLGVRPQSYWGSSWTAPVTVGDSVIFVQEKGNRIRDLSFTYSTEGYQGNDLSVMAEHLFDGHEIEEMTFAAEPWSVLWCVRDDGMLLGLTYMREQGVWGWHRHSTSGQFESVASIAEDGRDAVYFIVNREIDGQTVRYVERLEVRDVSSSETVYCVDCGLTYDGPPVANFSNLDHLEGEEVVAVADGNEVLGLIVEDGSVTLPNASSKVSIGLPYVPVIETLDLDLGSMQETLRGKLISISRVMIEVERSRGGWVGGRRDDGSITEMMEIKPRFDSDGYGAIDLKTYKQEVVIQPDWSSGGLRIEQRSAFPLAIRAIVPDVDIS